jgi:mRNA-degrading endonuclease RelE of RelBE toxin-antitoxin system
VRVLVEAREALEDFEDDLFDRLARDIDSLAFAPRREDAEELGEGIWWLRSAGIIMLYALDDEASVVRVVRVGPPEEILAEGFLQDEE